MVSIAFVFAAGVSVGVGMTELADKRGRSALLSFGIAAWMVFSAWVWTL